jgi:hypothetical protein
MEQIYYTQCPIGYGLGASNGFQIKRRSEHYPLNGDFRHLSLKAFLPGTRTLAPPALRYRRDGDIAEVAWLTPRSHEYETENGRLWGRPGGQFAHGLRLTGDELCMLARWPAGLYGRPFWKRSDPEPTLLRPPDAVRVDWETLIVPPTFGGCAELVRGEDVEILARLLSSAAQMVREGRTLFIIDEPERIGRRIALLTFAVPEAMRPALTFSTYHDRPEELFGFRIQGTVPAAKPNRAVLATLGIVADLAAGSFEPRIEPAHWARSLATWLVRRTAADEAAWVETCQELARRIPPPREEAEIWSDSWLDHLTGFRALAAAAAPVPDGQARWSEILDFAVWATRAGLTADWAAARPPSWWRGLAPEHTVLAEARKALLAQGGLRESWRVAVAPEAGKEIERAAASALAADWGEVAALWFAGQDRHERIKAVSTFLKAAPAELRGGFLAALLRGLPPDGAEEVLDRLRANPTFDDAILLPLDAARAARALHEDGDPGRLVNVLLRAAATSEIVVDVLGAVALEAAGRADAIAQLAPAIAELLDRADGAGWDAAWSWALTRDDGRRWIEIYLRRLLAHVENMGTWRLVHKRTPRPLRPPLARFLLDTAADPALAEEAFLWGVEEVLLPLPESERPADPSWPDAYLARVSGLDLARWLFLKGQRKAELHRWVSTANKLKQVSREQVARLKDCQAYAAALESGDAASLRQIHLPDVPAHERGALLEQILDHVGGASTEQLDLCLDSFRRAWPGAFDAGAPGLHGLAIPLARGLYPLLRDHSRWLARLRDVLARLDLRNGPLAGHEPNGLASEIVAATSGLTKPAEARWPLRQLLFGRTDAWRILAADARQDLRSPVPEHGVAILEQWDHHLDKGKDSARFFELLLNVARGPVLAALVASRADELRTLGILSWWDAENHRGARDDIREAFARLAPMAPLPEEALHAVRTWMRRADPSKLPNFELDGVLELEGAPVAAPAAPALDHLSAYGQARWRCLEAISAFSRSGLDAMARWELVRSWIEAPLSLDALDADDRHRFLAAMILGTDEHDEVRVDGLARWLVRSGVTDADRVGQWPGDVEGAVDVDLPLRRMEFVSNLRKEIRTRVVEARQARQAATR